MKRQWGMLWMAVLCLLMAACAAAGGPEERPAGETRLFTDSTGREVELPEKITRAASAGSLANIMLYSVAPEALVGWSSAPPQAARAYMEEKYWDLPEYGGFRRDDFNREALMASAPEVIIDVGEWDQGYREELDALQEQTGIPVILLEAGLDQLPAAYRALGTLLGAEERGEELAAYCEEVVSDAREKAASIPEEDRVRVYYGQDDGLSTILSGTIHSQIYELVGAEIVVESGGAQIKSGGGTVSMEQLMVWDPDVILFAGGSIYDSAGEDPAWSGLTAIREGRFYEIPTEPYNWLGRPPGPNRIVGVRWLGNLLYPEVFDCDAVREVQAYFRLFYRYELSDREAEELLARSTGKAAGASSEGG